MEGHEKQLREILLEHVLQIAFRMQTEGVIAAAPLVRVQGPQTLHACLTIAQAAESLQRA